MPNFNWGLALLLILAFLSHYATPLAPDGAYSNMVDVKRILQRCQELASLEYKAQVFALVAHRLAVYRQNNGYGDIGIYVEEIVSGLSWGHDAERLELRPNGNYVGYYHTASVAKLLIAYVFYHLDDLGQVNIEAVHTDPVVGLSQKWRPLIHRMLTHSVNLYHNIMLRYLGSALATDTLHKLGLNYSTLSRELAPAPGTSSAACLERYGTLEAPRTTPADLGKLLASLARQDVLSPKNNELFLHALCNTIYNSRIPQAINFAVPVAHKTGTKDFVYNDAALVRLPGNEFALVLLTKGAPGRIQSLMRDITRDLFDLHGQRRDLGAAQQAAEINELLQRLSIGKSWQG